MKKIIRILPAILMSVSLYGSVYANVDTDAETWTAPESGVEVQIPDSLRDAEGYITFSDGGEGIAPGSGVVSAEAIYVPMPGEEYRAAMAELEEAFQNGDEEKVTELSINMGQFKWELFNIYGIDNDRGEEELRAILLDRNANTQYYEGQEELLASVKALYENMQLRELGEKEGLRYYLGWLDPDAFLSLLDVPQIDPAYQDEYKELVAGNEQLADSISLTGGAALAEKADVGKKLTFETTDLEGNPVTSEEIFAGHAVTMINMWATWCDPCKNELPDLEVMAGDFEEQGCQIIGICLDAEDEETMAEGRAILEKAGVTYLNITPFEGREEMLPNTFYPTTYFVDENGIIFDETVVGAAVDSYPITLAKLLEQSETKE